MIAQPLTQEPASAANATGPATAPRPAVGRNASLHRRPDTHAPADLLATPATARSAVHATKSVVEEFFECTIEQIEAEQLMLRTRASNGEEGVAWLRIADIDESERKYIALGVPVRVAVVLNRDGKTHVRQHTIRVLRPDQWQAPIVDDTRKQIAAMFLERMRALVTR